MTDEHDRAGATPTGTARSRILVVAPAYPTATSFAGVFVADQVAALREAYDVQVVVPDPRGWRRAILGSAGPTGPAPGDVDVFRPVARTWVPRSGRSIAQGVTRAVAGVYDALARTSPPDVIHAHVIYPYGFAAVKVGERHGVPVVVTEHSGPFGATLQSDFARQAAAWTIDRAARILAVGPGLRDEILGLAPGRRIDVLGNVVDTDFFRPEPREQGSVRGPLRLLSLGIQRPQKAPEILLEAMATLAAHGRPIELVVGGDGPELPGLQVEVQRLGLSGSVRFVGVLSREEVRQWLRWCDVFVSASRLETFGLAIAEALACERPVVATRSGGPEAFFEATSGVLVDRDDPTGLAAAIESVADGAVTLDGRAGRRLIEARYGKVAFRTALGRIYDEVRVLAGARSGR